MEMDGTIAAAIIIVAAVVEMIVFAGSRRGWARIEDSGIWTVGGIAVAVIAAVAILFGMLVRRNGMPGVGPRQEEDRHGFRNEPVQESVKH